MGENIIETKSVSELLAMKFYIPNYQRGYRWCELQVKELLNDINNFSPRYNSDEKTWYCLQPLVVKKIKIENDKDCWYEVIDGQQRLTTIFLIIHYFNEMWVGKQKTMLPIIKYATRNESYDFLMSLEIDDKQSAYAVTSKEFKNYIDYFYMRQAYSTIHNWACKQGRDFNNNEFQSKFIYSTKVIWYETSDISVKVFTRLNIGKISLTNAELIKALFLNRSNFRSTDYDHIKLRQREIAIEWDTIEYTLQNDEFWLFLHEKGYDRPTRIDFIFDLICEHNELCLNDEIYGAVGSDDYRTFRYFYEYFNYAQPDIEKCWNEVKSYFQTFKEWFEDVELYHYVGYLIIEGTSICELVKDWSNSEDKDSFVNLLKEKIKGIINKCPPLDFQYKTDGSDKKKCRPILLFHNIQTIINRNWNNLDNEMYQIGVFYKFPFHLYKIENWDVEHISSNMTNEVDDVESRNEWLMNIYLSADETIKVQIQKYFNEKNKEVRNDIFLEIYNDFPLTKDQDWTQEDKNRLWNYTLLDSSTNRSYGNALFSGKRNVIVGKDKGVEISIPRLARDGRLQLVEEVKAESSFVPLCTKQVFMKYYSAILSDVNYWTKIDAEGYLNDIKECLTKLDFKK